MPMLKIWFLFSDWCGCETIVTKEVQFKGVWRNNAGNSDGIGSVNEMYCSRAEKIHAYIAYFIFYEKALFDASFFYWKKIKKRLNTALFYGAWKNVQRKK